MITHETVHYAQHRFNRKAFSRSDELAKEFVEGFAQYVTKKLFGKLSGMLELYHELGVPEHYSAGRKKFEEIQEVYGEEKVKEIALHGTPEEFQSMWESAHSALESRHRAEAEEALKKLDELIRGVIKESFADPDGMVSFAMQNCKKYNSESECNLEEAIGRALSDYFSQKMSASLGASLKIVRMHDDSLYQRILSVVCGEPGVPSW